MIWVALAAIIIDVPLIAWVLHVHTVLTELQDRYEADIATGKYQAPIVRKEAL